MHAGFSPVLSIRLQHGDGTANTALAFHAGRLLALHEADLPYVVR
jgi:carotenoid cleavage dioxygenase